ncbi:MAG: TIR domain-containing protein [Bacteroidota bacterium]
MYDVFISHTHKDKKPFTNQLVTDLKEKGIRTWYDSENMHVGNSLTQKVIDGIQQSKFFLIVLSENSILSEWVMKELKVRLETNHSPNSILPTLFGDIMEEQAPESIRKLDLLYADFRDPNAYQAQFKRIKETIKPPLISSFDNDQIRQLISRGKTEDAIKQLLNILPERNDFYNDIVVLSSQLQSINRNNRMGIMGFAEYSREQSKITMGVLQIISEINEH